MWQFAELRFADHFSLRFADLVFADPIIFCRLETSANPQIRKFYPYKYSLKCSHSNLRTTFSFWDSFGTVAWHLVD
jgi:hypothetical protein